MSNSSRWSVGIPVDAGIHVHDLGELFTDHGAVARSIAILLDEMAGAPRGRGATAAEEAKRQEDAQKTYAIAQGLADRVLRTLDRDLNAWVRWVLIVQPVVAEYSADQMWRLLEGWPAERSLELLSVPAVHRHIDVLRKSSDPKTRTRLRRLFERLALAPAPKGRHKRGALSPAELSAVHKIWTPLYEDVDAFRRRWKGILHDNDTRRAGFNLVVKWAPTVGLGTQNALTKILCDPKQRPWNACIHLLKAALPELEHRLSFAVLRKQLPNRSKVPQKRGAVNKKFSR